MPPAIAIADRQTGEEGQPGGLSSVDSSRRRISGPLNSGNFLKQKNPVAHDSSIAKDPTFPSSNILGRSSGSLRRPAVSSSRDVFVGSESDPQRSSTMEASPAALHRVSTGQSPVGSSDPRHPSSGRTTTHSKNYETTLKGIESLHFDVDDRVLY
ncbi:hypothetical protein HS088_TW04G00420 [Tripterygium wilfordii]|uniref:Uncharacterized protein n=2 Tax=Tripterygium wilfordii TaxID=458696 RepID=A0A7J7DQT2_TRIWF|nr:hypothetical protein HS088_TW04G00420 [Tripterygium wilfordii]